MTELHTSSDKQNAYNIYHQQKGKEKMYLSASSGKDIKLSSEPFAWFVKESDNEKSKTYSIIAHSIGSLLMLGYMTMDKLEDKKKDGPLTAVPAPMGKKSEWMVYSPPLPPGDSKVIVSAVHPNTNDEAPVYCLAVNNSNVFWEYYITGFSGGFEERHTWQLQPAKGAHGG